MMDDLPDFDSMRPIERDVLPNTIRPKPKTGRLVYVYWYIGFGGLITAAIFCFTVIIPSQEKGQYYISLLALFLLITFVLYFWQ